MHDAARKADGGNPEISEQRWLFIPHGIQLVIQKQKFWKTGVLKSSSLAQDGNEAFSSSFLGNSSLKIYI